MFTIERYDMVSSISALIFSETNSFPVFKIKPSLTIK